MGSETSKQERQEKKAKRAAGLEKSRKILRYLTSKNGEGEDTSYDYLNPTNEFPLQNPDDLIGVYNYNSIANLIAFVPLNRVDGFSTVYPSFIELEEKTENVSNLNSKLVNCKINEKQMYFLKNEEYTSIINKFNKIFKQYYTDINTNDLWDLITSMYRIHNYFLCPNGHPEADYVNCSRRYNFYLDIFLLEVSKSIDTFNKQYADHFQIGFYYNRKPFSKLKYSIRNQVFIDANDNINYKNKIEQNIQRRKKFENILKRQKKQEKEKNSLKTSLLVNCSNNENSANDDDYQFEAQWLVGICGLYFYKP